MIQCEQVIKRYGATEVLRGITTHIHAGEVVVILGPSGSGKSTLLRCINALERIDGGELRVGGLSVRGDAAQVRQIRREAGMVFQQFNLFPHLNALQNVMFGPRYTRGQSRQQARELAQSLLHKVGLADRMQHYPHELSGGQQQRVAIARALAIRPRLMLFDEPTSALDPALRHDVLTVMQTLAQEGMTMVVVTHEIEFARRVGTRLLYMEDGNILHDGPPARLLSDPPGPRLREFLQHVR